MRADRAAVSKHCPSRPAGSKVHSSRFLSSRDHWLCAERGPKIKPLMVICCRLSKINIRKGAGHHYRRPAPFAPLRPAPPGSDVFRPWCPFRFHPPTPPFQSLLTVPVAVPKCPFRSLPPRPPPPSQPGPALFGPRALFGPFLPMCPFSVPAYRARFGPSAPFSHFGSSHKPGPWGTPLCSNSSSARPRSGLG